MSHRIKRFAAFAIFALFYHFAAVDSISGLGGHHVDTKVDTKTHHSNDKFKSTRRGRIGVQVSRHRTKVSKLYASLKCDRGRRLVLDERHGKPVAAIQTLGRHRKDTADRFTVSIQVRLHEAVILLEKYDCCV